MQPSSRWRTHAYGAVLVALCSLFYLVVVALGYVASITVFANATVGQYLLLTVVLGFAGTLTYREIHRPTRLLEELDARRSDGEYADLEALATRLANQAAVADPELWIAPIEEPNSLTVGYRTPAICLTEGLLERFEDDSDRLEAVLAHEIAHVSNRDARVMTAVALPGEFLLTVGAVSFVGLSLLGVGGIGVRFAPDWFVDGYLVPLWLGSFGLLALWIVLTLVFDVVADAFSRHREFAADRGAVALTGNSTALVETLRDLEGAQRIPETDLRESDTLGRFCIRPLDEGRPTHPPVEERVDRLRTVRRELEVS
ncbi:M48 family metalloprotease [Halobacteria archaeon AArc-m2/3/4]|uniref:M48 family metalloprotease n=1 Tax=Natronoglomus mannanivorans TaxID=2979990 RepID=A0AAP2Z1N4_9EURY|nr:M48 family metalloprotease [Halobacteria archaeon AArc-xg1-1]MCU4972885.1 M48 family metalloprotease [Halobacteria archaeon AArc-m2/3/4]